MNTIFTTTTNNTNTNTINNNTPCILHADGKPYEFGLRSIDYYKSVDDPKTGVRFERTDNVKVLEDTYLQMLQNESAELKDSTKISYTCSIDDKQELIYNQLLDDYIGLLKGSSYWLDGYAGNGKTTAVKWLMRSLVHKDLKGNPKAEKIYYLCVGERPSEFKALKEILKSGDYGYGYYAKYVELGFSDDNPGKPLEDFAQALYNAMQDCLEGIDVVFICDSASRIAIEANQFPRPNEATAPGGLFPSALKWIAKLFRVAVKRLPHPTQKGSLTTIGTILRKENDRQSDILADTAESESNGHISVGLSNDPKKFIDTVTGIDVPTNINLVASNSRAFKREGVPMNQSEIEYLTEILQVLK